MVDKMTTCPQQGGEDPLMKYKKFTLIDLNIWMRDCTSDGHAEQPIRHI